ncbi:VOC family protein [Shewanella pneumatophori]|uniref:VOC family protein n=1 Tax=Shewanella pneumatophori TaxID=314092 RepID=A0A9X2CH93_9GAMM|nr:VOC family protein [Shewanella pneumatophori]MCL1139801.1 VOC family protein [Shewanella pneumatophori]
MTYQELINSWSTFSSEIQAFTQDLGLDTLALECDHTALRVNSNQSADLLRHEFARVGNIISDNMINGRPILIIELNTPLMMGNTAIECVELPYPSDKVYPQQGWEHIELVLDCGAADCDELTHALLEKAPQLAAIIAGETEIKVKMSSPKGDKERLANPTIAFKKNGLCIKVHSQSIKAVIASEAE